MRVPVLLDGARRARRRGTVIVTELFAGFPEPDETVAGLAARAGLQHETVRVLHNGTTARSGPGFLVVADIAHARGISLDQLAARIRDSNGDT